MIEVSMYYIHSNRNPRYIAFVKYEKYIKVILSSFRSIILSIEEFMAIPYLFEFYLLSMLTTQDLTKVNFDKNSQTKCTILVEVYWKRLYFTKKFTSKNICGLSSNPLNSKEPKRQTSYKKIRKFIKNFMKDFNHEPMYCIESLIDTRCYDSINILEKYNKYEKLIPIFIGIKKKYGKDIYEYILKFI